MNPHTGEEVGEQTQTGAPARVEPAPPPEAPRRRFPVWIAAGGLIAVVAGAAILASRKGREEAPRAAAVPAPLPVATAGELPQPELGVDAPGPTARPAMAPTAAPAVSEAARPAARFTLQISSVPSATVFLDGREIGPSVPARTVELSEGMHEIRLQGEGMSHTQRIRVGQGGIQRFHHAFPVGYLVVKADASWSGASVIVDGKYRGTLSDAPIRLVAGEHGVTLHRADYQPASTRIEIPKGREAVWSPAAAVPVEAPGSP